MSICGAWDLGSSHMLHSTLLIPPGTGGCYAFPESLGLTWSSIHRYWHFDVSSIFMLLHPASWRIKQTPGSFLCIFCVLALRQIFSTVPTYLASAWAQCSLHHIFLPNALTKEDEKRKPKTALTYKPQAFHCSQNVHPAVPTFTLAPGSSTLPAQQGDPQAHRKLNIALGISELCKKEHSGHTVFSTRNASIWLCSHLAPTDRETKDFVHVFP